MANGGMANGCDDDTRALWEQVRDLQRDSAAELARLKKENAALKRENDKLRRAVLRKATR